MKRKLLVGVFLTIFFNGLGCASTGSWKSQPNMQQATNEYYVATISPIFIFDGYKGFALTIHNKSPDNLEVVWANTFHIHNDKKTGGFIFEGMRSGDRLETPAIISGSLFSKDIFPVKLAQFSTLAMSTVHEPMESGENGVLLSVKVDGKEITEKITLNFSQEPGK
jgi:hypothetical protein